MSGYLAFSRGNLGWFTKNKELSKITWMDLNTASKEALADMSLVILWDGEWGVVLKDETQRTNGVGTLVAATDFQALT